jgi:NAD(P)-dependent dehydrogenase (short-subunit alcohol dehydrogenase family)
MMTKVLAAELGPDNIQVNAIAPGFFKTDFSAAIWQNEALAKRVVDGTPLGRMGETTELAGIALYLAAPASNFTTGSVMTIDGGSTIR